ncbi:MAG: AMP-binding protein [Acidobacteria bacterium]|nr:AMP-binding protein [Acidobacteriota bacterium]
MNLANIFIKNLENDENKTILFGLSTKGEILWQSTKKEILKETYSYLRALKNYGIKKGDRVALSLTKSTSLVAAHISILASGGVVVPLNPSLSTIELEKILIKAKPSLAIITSNFLSKNPKLTNYIDGSCWVEDLESNNLENIFNLIDILSSVLVSDLETIDIVEVDKNDIALIVFTSGTTGLPKGVGLTHQNLFTNLTTLLIDTWGFSKRDKLLHVLPPHHIHGLGLGIYGSLLVGNAVFLLEKFDPFVTLQAIKNHQITVFMGVPTLYHRMLNIEGDFDVTSIRLFISGSAPLSSETFEQFNKRFGLTILERYGLTETLFNASNPLNGLRKAGSVGLTVKGVEIQITDLETLTSVDIGNVGEIWIKGANVFPGYWQDEENTKVVFYNGWFRTGDLGKFDQDGYLSIVGRIKELIIVGGTNVTPGEIEKILEKIPGILECAVTSLSDLDLGEKIVACIVAKPNTNLVELELALKTLCQHELAPYKRPKEYCFINMLPRNIMGKLERNKLRELIIELNNKQ